MNTSLDRITLYLTQYLARLACEYIVEYKDDAVETYESITAIHGYILELNIVYNIVTKFSPEKDLVAELFSMELVLLHKVTNKAPLAEIEEFMGRSIKRIKEL